MGDVIAFPGPADGLWPPFRRFMSTGPWQVRQDFRLPSLARSWPEPPTQKPGVDDHLVTVYGQDGVGWRWRVEFLPSREVRWGSVVYPTLDGAKRGCWSSCWPGEREATGGSPFAP